MNVNVVGISISKYPHKSLFSKQHIPVSDKEQFVSSKMTDSIKAHIDAKCYQSVNHTVVDNCSDGEVHKECSIVEFDSVHKET